MNARDSLLVGLRQKARQAINADDGIAPDLYADLPPEVVLALVDVAVQAKLVSSVARRSVVSGDVSVALAGLREALARVE